MDDHRKYSYFYSNYLINFLIKSNGAFTQHVSLMVSTEASW